MFVDFLTKRVLLNSTNPTHNMMLYFLFSQHCRSVSSQHCSCFDYPILLFFFHTYAGYTLPFSTVRLTHFLYVTFQLSIRSDYDDWRPALASLLQPIPFPKEWVFSNSFLSSHSYCRYHFHFLDVSGKLSKKYTKIWEVKKVI